ncbi:hypothetical protein SIN8267_00103 [Sinobacterium norvegicum]|uniref:Uncharacterized protein n=1 Tax=Sinobacterium norvegicum TaxID=1641715 RepID=A0ABN8EBZ7_9GAMM|nr:hypothetical protein SIN8267_00103 [Sinobacterium norvegicum]
MAGIKAIIQTLCGDMSPSSGPIEKPNREELMA